MTARSEPFLIGLLVCLLVAAPSGCKQVQRDCDEHSASSAAVDPALMAFLSRARAAHHAADLQGAAVDKTLAPLLELVAGPIPGSATQAPAEVREVLADTHARIAELESQLERFDSALRRLQTARQYVPETSYFRGHLFETEGLVAQRQAALLDQRGLTVEATAARARALACFETAMEIQSAVIQSTPPEPAAPQRMPDTIPAQPAK